MRNYQYVLSGVCALVTVGASAMRTDAANCPGTITANYDANEDITTSTLNANCITVNGTGITVNLHGNSIICNNASGCGVGVLVSNTSSNVVVEDGQIIEGTGKWGSGIQNGTSGGAAVSNTMEPL